MRAPRAETRAGPLIARARARARFRRPGGRGVRWARVGCSWRIRPRGRGGGVEEATLHCGGGGGRSPVRVDLRARASGRPGHNMSGGQCCLPANIGASSVEVGPTSAEFGVRSPQSGRLRPQLARCCPIWARFGQVWLRLRRLGLAARDARTPYATGWPSAANPPSAMSSPRVTLDISGTETLAAVPWMLTLSSGLAMGTSPLTKPCVS